MTELFLMLIFLSLPLSPSTISKRSLKSTSRGNVKGSLELRGEEREREMRGKKTHRREPEGSVFFILN